MTRAEVENIAWERQIGRLDAEVPQSTVQPYAGDFL